MLAIHSACSEAPPGLQLSLCIKTTKRIIFHNLHRDPAILSLPKLTYLFLFIDAHFVRLCCLRTLGNPIPNIRHCTALPLLQSTPWICQAFPSPSCNPSLAKSPFFQKCLLFLKKPNSSHGLRLFWATPVKIKEGGKHSLCLQLLHALSQGFLVPEAESPVPLGISRGGFLPVGF